MKNNVLASRDAFKPFTYPEFYDYWLTHEQSHWLHTEVEMSQDVKDYKNLPEEDKDFLTKVLRFFVAGDTDIAGGYLDGYIPLFRNPEIRMFLTGVAAREILHQAAYAHLIETLGLPETIYNEFLQHQQMRDKHEFLQQIDTTNIIDTITAYSIFGEGVQLFSTFVMLLNYQRNGKLRGLGQIITWSIADETLHADGMTALLRQYIKENPAKWTQETKNRVYEIGIKMVELEDAFIDLIFSMCEPEGLTADEVKQYIRFLADRRWIGVGLKGYFKVKKNPLPWVEMMVNAPSHTNFFEAKSTDYGKGAVTGSWGDVWG
jgi:ribonucleoside-diphosphate reductase beta chain